MTWVTTNAKGTAYGLLTRLKSNSVFWADWSIEELVSDEPTKPEFVCTGAGTQETEPTDGSTGLDNPAYNFPKGATTIYQVVQRSRMSPDVGECFRLLYMYATSGAYKLPGDTKDITTLALQINMSAFVYNAMQGLYRSGNGERNSAKRDMEKAQYYIHHEWLRLGNEGKHDETLEEAYELIDEVVGKPYS